MASADHPAKDENARLMDWGRRETEVGVGTSETSTVMTFTLGEIALTQRHDA
jgi:hypothetical protein